MTTDPRRPIPGQPRFRSVVTGYRIPRCFRSPSGHPAAALPKYRLLEERFRSVMNEEKRWSMVRGLRKTGDLLARSDLCHLHDGRAEAESCALDEKLQGRDRDVVLVARSGSNLHVWVVRRSLSEIINGRLLPKARARADGRNGGACR